MSNSNTVIRNATPADIPLVMELIRALAEYEKLSDRVTATPDLIEQALFGPRPMAECLIAESDNCAAGFALFFHNFSTFIGKPGIYLEDLFVKPEFRGCGLGKALLARLAQIALERDCGRMEWAVVDWNEPSIKFYRALGAESLDDWEIFRLKGQALVALAMTHTSV
ncbi:MAG: GNAT family N-acetyltransferase [Pyrinomonadaceae bacterium]